MKMINLFSLASIALIGLAQPAFAGPHGGGGGFGGGFAGGGHPGGGHFGGFGGGARFGGGFRSAPAFSPVGPRFGGVRNYNFGRMAPSYSSGARVAPIQPRVFNAPTNRSTSLSAGRLAATNRQPNRVGSVARQNARVSNSQVSATAVRQAIANHNTVARHDPSWHSDWDRHRAHFHNGHIFVFVDGFWWGLYPWDYYSYYYDYGYDPYDYYGYPYDYYDYSPYNYDDQSAYVNSDPYANPATVSEVQSDLAKLGYYHDAIDGVLGDETQAAIAHYQEDHDLSVTGTVTAATLQSLGIT